MRSSDSHPLPTRVGIVGAGACGARWAAWWLERGAAVTVRDEVPADTVRERILAACSRRTDIDRLTVRHDRAAFADREFVIEAVTEDIGMKRDAVHLLEESIAGHVPIASTTASLALDSIAAELNYPERVVGWHAYAGIIELVRQRQADFDAFDTVSGWLQTANVPFVTVDDRPGRFLTPMRLAGLSEAVQLVAEGLPPDAIDARMRAFGLAGPLETLDRIGFDTVLAEREATAVLRGERFASNLRLERFRANGWNGRSTDIGFYRYKKGRPVGNDLARLLLWQQTDDAATGEFHRDPDALLTTARERIVLRQLNEAAMAFGEESQGDPASIDRALVTAGEWPEGRGGPFAEIDRRGIRNVVEDLWRLSKLHGIRFIPCVELQRRATADVCFYRQNARFVRNEAVQRIREAA